MCIISFLCRIATDASPEAPTEEEALVLGMFGLSLQFPSLLILLFTSPICVAEHLAPFLPSHPAMPVRGEQSIDAVSAAPFGSASINLISWAYIKMLGGKGLVDSSKIALLNANYMASRLQGHYNLRYKNDNGRVAHELLIDLAEFDKSVGLKVTDFAKRLQDYGFHPPTCSWPISTCMLIEPTESETLEELDRYYLLDISSGGAD